VDDREVLQYKERARHRAMASKKSKAKAKKAARAKESVQPPRGLSLVLQIRRQIVGTPPGRDILGPCTHGDIVPEDDICREFLGAYLDKFDAVKDSSKSCGIGESFLATAAVDKYAALWNDCSKMELIVSIFVSNGTQNILDEDIKAARQSAWFACYFEEYLVSELCRKRATIDWQKVQEFERADERTLISFLRKRIDCQCLDGKYKQVKRIVTKMGICMNPHCSLPDRQVEQKIMQKCARCRCAYYCSRECQKADWKIHRPICDDNLAKEAVLEAEQKALAKQKAARRVEQQFDTGDSSPRSILKVIVFALIGWNLFLIHVPIFVGIAKLFLPQYPEPEVVGGFSDEYFEDGKCSNGECSEQHFEDVEYFSDYDKELDPCWTEQEALDTCLILPGLLQSDIQDPFSYEGIDRAWDDLSDDTQDAYHCASFGIRWFYEDFGMDPVSDDICSGEFGTEEEVCSELMVFKDCVQKSDVCKSEALALLKCRDLKDGGCGCPW